ncbi:hypothetical protein [Candidatus Trichorickettsia mobilis]|uniref:hypothetical protein n=1 Tax=Candidatus Trichorickettsia mobilis TaxID=1346319 RepID=UPI00292D2C5F|nr:hypothetical protein [Candidatus Trichorickettsia mobilis]
MSKSLNTGAFISGDLVKSKAKFNGGVRLCNNFLASVVSWCLPGTACSSLAV